MSLFVTSTTLREVMGYAPSFPSHLRHLIARSVEQVTADTTGGNAAGQAMAPQNLDSRIEANLGLLAPSVQIRPNGHVIAATGFHCDLVVESRDALVCIEIGQGGLAGLGLGILKMMAFGSQQSDTQEKPCYGAFIVPADDVVAGHVSGIARESSYEYVCQLLSLVAEVAPLLLTDILVVGYVAPGSGNGSGEAPRGHGRRRGSAITFDPTDEFVETALRGYPQDSILQLRRRLKEACPDLREKHNATGQYFGYAVGMRPDALYIYVQKKGLVLDLDMSRSRMEGIAAMGFEIRPRDNFQHRQGWLTGLRVPDGSDRLDAVLNLALEALERRGTE